MLYKALSLDSSSSCCQIGECKYCAFVGDVSAVKGSGPQHARGCLRWAQGTAASPRVTAPRRRVDGARRVDVSHGTHGNSHEIGTETAIEGVF